MKKYIFVLIFLMVSYSLQSQVMHGQVDYKKTLKFNGNYIVFSKPHFFIWYGGKKVYSDLTPIKLNGEHIFDENTVSYSALLTGNKTFNYYLKDKLRIAAKSLPNGNYTMPTLSLVIDKNGSLVYYDFYHLKNITNSSNIKAKFTDVGQFQKYLKEMEKRQEGNDEITIPLEQKSKVESAMYEALKNCPKFIPATKDGKPVHYLLEDGFNETIIVQNQIVTFKKAVHR